MPNRIRVPGAFKYHLLPPEVTYVGRAVWGYPRSIFANPHGTTNCKRCGGDHTNAEAVELFRYHLAGDPELVAAIRAQLAGRTLACWCRPDEECHAEVLLAVAAGGAP